MNKAKGKAISMLVVTACMILVGPAWAETQDWSSFKQTAREIQSVKGDFIQKRFLSILKEPLIAEGSFAFHASGSLRWEYRSPLRSVMLQKGEEVRLYKFAEKGWVPEALQGLEARKMVLSEMTQWLHGRFDESRVFSARYVPGTPSRIILDPREEISRFILGIEIILSEKPGVIHSIEIKEPERSRMVIEFSNIEINRSLPPGIFERP